MVPKHIYMESISIQSDVNSNRHHISCHSTFTRKLIRSLSSKTKKNVAQLMFLQSWTKNCRQVHEIKKKRFFYRMLYRWLFFCHLLASISKFIFWLANWVVAIKSKQLRDFLKICQLPNISSRKLFHKSWGNSCITFWW